MEEENTVETTDQDFYEEVMAAAKSEDPTDFDDVVFLFGGYKSVHFGIADTKLAKALIERAEMLRRKKGRGDYERRLESPFVSGINRIERHFCFSESHVAAKEFVHNMP